jgi:hypothetical protein
MFPPNRQVFVTAVPTHLPLIVHSPVTLAIVATVYLPLGTTHDTHIPMKLCLKMSNHPNTWHNHHLTRKLSWVYTSSQGTWLVHPDADISPLHIGWMMSFDVIDLCLPAQTILRGKERTFPHRDTRSQGHLPRDRLHQLNAPLIS